MPTAAELALIIQARDMASKTLQGVQRQVQGVSKTVAGVTNTLPALNAAPFANGTEHANQSLRDMDKHLRGGMSSLDSFGSKMTMTGAIVSGAISLPLIGLGKAALDTAMDYESSMHLLQAVTGATGEQMAALGKRAKELGADMELPATSAGDAAKAMTELAKSGLAVNDILAASKGVLALAAAGQMTEAEAAEVAANALNAFKLAGSEATRVADLLAAAANASSAEVHDMALALKMSAAVFAAAGIPIEDLTAALGLMANAGIKNSDAGTSLKQMMLQLQNPSKEAKGMMEELGVAIYDAEGNMRPFRDIIDQFSKSLVVGNQTISTATVKVAEVGKEFKNAAKEAGTVQKQLDSLTSKIGPLTEKIGIQEREVRRMTLDYNALAATYGVASKQAQEKMIAIDKLRLSMGENQKTLGRYNTEIENARFAMNEATGNIGKYQAATEQTVTSVNKMTQAKRDEMLATIFGSDAVRAANVVMAGGTEQYDKMKEAVTKQGAALELARARMKGLSGALQGLQSQIETVLLIAALPFLGMLEGWVRTIADLVPQINELNPAILNAAIAFGAVLAVAGPLALILGLASSALAFFLSPIGLVVVALAVLAAGAVLLAAAWSENWGDIQGKTQAVLDYIVPFIQRGLDGMASFWALHGDKIMALLGKLWTWTETAFDNGVKAVVAILTYFGDRWQENAWWIEKVWRVVWDNAQILLTAAMKNLGNIIDLFTAASQGDWRRFGEILRIIWTEAWDAIAEIMRNALTLLGDLAGALAQAVWDKITTTDWPALGGKIIEGMVEGLKRNWNSFVDTIRNLVSAAWDVVQGFFGIGGGPSGQPENNTPGAERLAGGLRLAPALAGGGSTTHYVSNRSDTVVIQDRASAALYLERQRDQRLRKLARGF